MKKIILMLLTCFLCSCTLPSAGTLGGWDTVVFPVEQKDMDTYMKLFYKQYPQFIVPEEKKYIIDYWEKAGYDFLKGMFFYLEGAPTRIYYVTFIPGEFDDQNPKYARIALRAVYKEENSRWFIKDKLNEREQSNFNDLFKKEIVLKLELLTKTKSYIQK